MLYIKDTMNHTAQNFDTLGEEDLMKTNEDLHADGYYIEVVDKNNNHLCGFVDEDEEKGGVTGVITDEQGKSLRTRIND